LQDNQFVEKLILKGCKEASVM